MTRRSFLAGTLAGPLAAAPQTPMKRPNVVLILADDLGSGDLSCYGARDVQTPYIDSIARAGVRFTQFYSNSPVCSPTRAALMTGSDPDLVGVPGVIRTNPLNSWGSLAREVVTLPDALQKRGYETAMVGKWHLGLSAADNPVWRGFHSFKGFLGDMMDDYYTHLRHGNNYMRDGEKEIKPEGHATDLFTGWAVEYLKRSHRQPFFLYLAYNAPHTPIQPTPESLAAVRKRLPDLPEKRAKLVALIEHMDEGVGRVLDAARQHSNTLVIFTSDNGGQVDVGGTNGTLRGGKQHMYEGGIRVPCVAMWPGNIEPNSRSHAALQVSDLYATVLNGEFPAPRPTLFFVRREGGRPYFGQDYYAIRKGPWKLLHNTPFEPYELYNLADDPGERNNVIAANPKIAADLIRELESHIIQAGHVPWSPKSVETK